MEEAPDAAAVRAAYRAQWLALKHLLLAKHFAGSDLARTGAPPGWASSPGPSPASATPARPRHALVA